MKRKVRRIYFGLGDVTETNITLNVSARAAPSDGIVAITQANLGDS
jgi:hypothetical protein